MSAPTTTKLPPTDTGCCGTYAGYGRHRKRKEQPCDPCMDARRAYQRKRDDEMVALRPVNLTGAKPLPPWAHPYAGQDVMHAFRPLTRTQCVDCFGWLDDPRHPVVSR